MSDRTDTSRRHWLRSVGRLSLAAALGGGVTALVARNDAECTDPGLCRGCAELARCNLPNAASVRQAIRDKQGYTDAR